MFATVKLPIDSICFASPPNGARQSFPRLIIRLVFERQAELEVLRRSDSSDGIEERNGILSFQILPFRTANNQFHSQVAKISHVSKVFPNSRPVCVLGLHPRKRARDRWRVDVVPLEAQRPDGIDSLWT